MNKKEDKIASIVLVVFAIELLVIANVNLYITNQRIQSFHEATLELWKNWEVPIDYSISTVSYPDNLTNDYVFSHATNIFDLENKNPQRYDPGGVYEIDGVKFLSVKDKHIFTRMDNSSLYQNEGILGFDDWLVVFDYNSNIVNVTRT